LSARIKGSLSRMESRGISSRNTGCRFCENAGASPDAANAASNKDVFI